MPRPIEFLCCSPTAKPTHCPTTPCWFCPQKRGFQGPRLPPSCSCHWRGEGTGHRLWPAAPTTQTQPLLPGLGFCGSQGWHHSASPRLLLCGPISNKVGSQPCTPRQQTDSPGHHEVTPGHRPCLLQRLFQKLGGSRLGEEARSRSGRGRGPGRNFRWKDPLGMPREGGDSQTWAWPRTTGHSPGSGSFALKWADCVWGGCWPSPDAR